MNILITGGSGFLGRQIVEQAKKEGHTVFAPKSEDFDLNTLENVVSYFNDVLSKVRRIDVLIHAAAYYGGLGINLAEPATIFHRNCQMALNVFEIARKFKIKKVLPIGSACAYPGNLRGFLKEDNYWNGSLHETVEAYGFSKKLQQVAQRAYFNQHGIESNHLVLTNLYGENDVFTEYRAHVLSAMIKKFTDAKDTVFLWGDGSAVREFMYVKEAATAIIKALEIPHDISPLNIGTGIGTTIKELAEKIKLLTGFTGEIVWDTEKPTGIQSKVLDITKMKQKLAWEPKISLDEGLKITVDWYIKNKNLADLKD